MKIFLTGANSHLARVLLPQLCSQSDIELITGIDIHPTQFNHDKFNFKQCDIRDEAISALMREHDVLIHLAFVVLRNKQLGQRRKQRKLVRNINIDGSKNVFTLAAYHRYKQIIHLSSAIVYGSQAENPLYMKEDQPLSPIPGFSYAEDKVELENWLAQFALQHGDIKTAVFRPHVILGAHSQPFLIQILKQPFHPRLPEPAPLIQVIWEDDVARAIVAATQKQASGKFNLAAEPAMSFKQMLTRTQRLRIPLPIGLMTTLHKLTWHFSGKLEEPGWLGGMRHPLTINCDHAKQVLHWSPRKTTEQLLEIISK